MKSELTVTGNKGQFVAGKSMLKNSLRGLNGVTAGCIKTSGISVVVVFLFNLRHFGVAGGELDINSVGQ